MDLYVVLDGRDQDKDWHGGFDHIAWSSEQTWFGLSGSMLNET